MKKKGVFLLLTSSIILSSCLHLDFDGVINSDGYATIKVDYDYSEYRESMLAEYGTIRQDLLPENVCEGTKIPNNAENFKCIKTNDFMYSITTNIDYGKDGAFTQEGDYYFFNLYKASISGDTDNKIDTQEKVDIELENAESFGITGTFTFTMPGELVSAEAGKIIGNTVVFDYSDIYFLQDTHIVSKKVDSTKDTLEGNEVVKQPLEIINTEVVDTNIKVQFTKNYLIHKRKVLQQYSKVEIERIEGIIGGLSQEQIQKAQLHLSKNNSNDIFVLYVKALIDYKTL